MIRQRANLLEEAQPTKFVVLFPGHRFSSPATFATADSALSVLARFTLEISALPT
ncbi:MAG TPA: hypothetical protein VMO88_11440 [Acidimicrobiales bacterium]|nr:hypothetical protein [Acidimicrobiales bacterium]